jgi:hypothetical protein
MGLVPRDVIVMKITTRKPKMMATPLTNDDLKAGSLDHPRCVQADGIYAREKDLICDTIGIVRPEQCRRSVLLHQNYSLSTPPDIMR